MSSISSPTFLAYPETLDLRRLIVSLTRQDRTGPISFLGTVKVHGTNAAVVFSRNYADTHIQSRHQIITTAADNQGCANFLSSRISNLREKLKTTFPNAEEVMVVGEFAGQSIQKGVGTAKCPKFFAIFAIRVDGLWMPAERWRDISCADDRIFNLYDFQTYSITIDFQNGVDDSVQEAVRALTQTVEDECPVALKLGGIKGGVGEGIVWTEVGGAMAEPLRFKSKGPKFSGVGQAPKMSKTIDNEKMERIQAFVEYAVTNARMQQGLDYLKETGELNVFDKRNIPKHGKWVLEDALKEEGDVLEEMGLGKSDVAKAVMNAAKVFFLAAVEENVLANGDRSL